MAEKYQAVFSSNEDVEKTAFLNWRTEKGNDILNLLNLANGFMLAAVQLAKAALADNEKKTADITIFPMLMNANHGIELYLKGMTWLLNLLTANPNRIEGSHNIHQIYDTVRSKMKAYKGNLTLKEFNEATENLRSYLTELTGKLQPQGKKDKMDFSRYPFDNSYQEHFYVAEMSNVEIDLENFAARFEAIHKDLEQLTDFLFYQELQQDW
jgi:hypothetical protein